MAPQPESARPQTDSTTSASQVNTPRFDTPEAWELRCADCGESWSVTAESMIQGNDWILCPRCRPAHTPAPTPPSPGK
jgi:DNA-directed RNA polymerase subunit RPC12/RpoP